MTTISLAESSRQVEELVKGAEAAARTGPVDDALQGIGIARGRLSG